MKKIFIGLLFIFFNFHLEFDFFSLKIGLLPDFIGYFLIWNGLNEFSDKSESFLRARMPSFIMILWSAVVYVGDLLGGFGDLSHLLLLLSVVEMVFSFYITYEISCGMGDLELQTGGGEMRTGRLLSAWKVLTACQVFSFINIFLIPAAAVMFMMIALIAAICYLVYFHTAWKAYELSV